ncbi:hypothetical protein DID88_009028 [Monilinia fructigena]|uniref:FACT complex subunit n=1 Tax=Monilinia fructigena TaxID=38457 RepID=A0A395IKT4_9HELO|nr:hypothetical protein DID88_009028 [Monilinia fructigena]
MVDIRIDKNLFQERLSHFISAWKADKRGDGGRGKLSKKQCDSFLVIRLRVSCDTLSFHSRDSIYIVTTAKKAKHLEPLKGGKVPLEILVRGKDAAANEKLFTKITDVIKSSGKKIGILPKDSSSGPFVDEWKKVYSELKDVEEVDIAPALSAALAVKDENELRAMRNSSKACTALMNPYFLEEMSGILDEEKKSSTAPWPIIGYDFDSAQLDWTHGPIIQSGGKYDLKMSAQVHNLVMKEIRDGAHVKDIYAKALALIRAKKPELEKHFLKNVGAGIGIETRDPTLLLNAKSTRSLKDGMTLCVTTGFNDIENKDPQDKKSKIYSLVLSDTVRVTQAEPVIFTGDAPSELDATSFFFKDEEDEPAPEPKARQAKKDSTVGAVATKNITKTKLRAERATQVDEGAEARRREHQKELAKRKHADGLARFTEATGDQNVRDLAIVMDAKNSTIVLPIMGRPVPFHIQTIKNASKSDEGEFSYLRINFLSPGQGVGRKDDQPFEDAQAHFVRSLTFRSHDGDRFQDIANQIGDMKRAAVKREQEKKDMEDVVEQDKLVEIRNRRPIVMDNVFIRPAMDGKRVPGKVEIHQNGLRYQSPLNLQHRVDILFSNVKHLFFQPCDHELIVIIHVHLKDPNFDWQEKDQGCSILSYGDEEEFEAEQEERRRRADLDRQFKTFAEKIADSDPTFFCQPSTDCLVQLTEPPFMVITLEDIEIAHLERVQFGLKNFDLVFVFKDFHRAPSHINTIPVESLENVKECSLLMWMGFLGAESDDEDGDDEDEESAFEMSDDELVASEESSEEDSDFDSNASEDEGEEDSEGESEGEDWDELEKKAKRKDMESGLEDEEEAPKKKRKH